MCRFPLHTGGIGYILNERVINIEMKVYWEIVVGLNQSFFTKISSRALIKVNYDALITR